MSALPATLTTVNNKEKDMVEVIRGNRKVEWVDIGEGLCGEYDPSDPDDIELLRFDVLELTNIHGLFSDSPVMEWEVLDDASYCTQMPADSSDDILHRGATMIMDATYGKSNVKKICEELSWINPDWCVDGFTRPPTVWPTREVSA